MKDKLLSLSTLASPIIFVLGFTILGFITPDYDPLRRTISRLSIECYGWIQQLNFIQFAIGMGLSGFLISKTLVNKDAKVFISRAANLCSAFLLLTVIFPINPIEVTRFSFSLLTPSGMLHVLLVLLFITMSPHGIYHLTNIFQKEDRYRKLVKPTKLWGLSAIISSFILLVFIYYDLFSGYRGLFEKLLAIWIIIWLEMVNLQAVKVKDSF